MEITILENCEMNLQTKFYSSSLVSIVVTIKQQKNSKLPKIKFYENWPKFLFGQKIF